MANKILPILLILMLPVDLIAGLSRGIYPTQATLMALLGAIIGVYLARKLWAGGAARLEASSRLQFMNEQGHNFDPQSEETQIRLDNARLNYLLGAGFLIFGVFLTGCFIASYLAATPFATTETALGLAVQIGIIVLFNLLVTGIEALGANIFLKR
jgi:hypothetical protein